MKIALDATPLTMSSGGLPRYVAELARALAKGFRWDRFFLSSDQSFPSELPRLPGPKNALERRWWLYGAEAANRRAGIELFHGTNFAIPYFARRPTVLTVHDLSPWMDPAWHGGAERIRKRTPRMIGLATMILTPSEAVRQQVMERFRVTPERIVATPLAAAKRFRPTAGARRGDYFLFVGTLEPRKNIGMLLEAWRELRREAEIDLILAGRRREDFPALGAEPGLTVLGETPEEDLPGLYSNAMAVIYPSHYEGFGLPVLEAMQCGAPVLISQDAALTEVAGDTALAVGSAGELLQAMREVRGRPEFRARLAENSLARAAQFSWAKTARRTHEVYEEAVRRFGR